MKLTKEDKEVLLLKAIKSDKQRLTHLEAFLENHPLVTIVNKTVALELLSVMMSIEQEIEKFKTLLDDDK